MRSVSQALLCIAVALIGVFGVSYPGHSESSILISEFMASNRQSLPDEDGDFPDWIELVNSTRTPVNLANWSIADLASASKGKRWIFPSTNLPPQSYLVLFASGKDRRAPGRPLHANFKLNRDGDGLVLYSPDGQVADGLFGSRQSLQVEDVSFGRAATTLQNELIPPSALVSYWVPTSGQWDATWTLPSALEPGWRQGLNAIGYDDRLPDDYTLHGSLLENIWLDLNGRQASLYVRVPFNIASPAEVDGLALNLKYADGFVAFINGVEVAHEHRPLNLGWNSTATDPRDPALFGNRVELPLGREAREALRAGTNWLAVQGLAASRTNRAFIVSAGISTHRWSADTTQRVYFPSPTPGQPNGTGSGSVGPLLSDISASPSGLAPGMPIPVSIRATPSLSRVQEVTLRYRVQYGSEITLPMSDDGKNRDGIARDGVFGCEIPTQGAAPGQMIRWYVLARDEAGTISRWPPPGDRDNAPVYMGTLLQTNVQSALPVFHWFVDAQNLASASTLQGTRCSVFFDGEFYDNVGVRIRGQLSTNWSKHSYKFDFNPGHLFRYRRTAERVEEVNLNSTWSDKAYMRTLLSWEAFRDAGVPFCESFALRVHRNGDFFSVAQFVEQPDERWLKRNGLDPEGALYKMNTGLDSTALTEKKTPQDGDLRQLDAFIAGIASGNSNQAAFLYDHVDLYSVINYLAVNTLIHDNDSAAKNFFLYQDERGSGEWRMLPWDKDLTFGHNYMSAGGLSDEIWADFDHTNSLGSDHPFASPSHPLFGDLLHQKENGHWNRLIDALYQEKPIRQMYLRRLRSLMDTLLQPPGTPHTELRFESRIDTLQRALRADVELDRQFNGTPAYGRPQDLGTAAKDIETEYLIKRRIHLFSTHNETNAARTYGCALIPEPAAPGPDIPRFGNFERSSEGVLPDEEFLELVNPTLTALDISGWEVRGLIQHVFRPGTVIPPTNSLWLCRNTAAFRARARGPSGGQKRLVQGNYAGSLRSGGGAVELWEGARYVSGINLDDARSPAQRFLRIVRLNYHPWPGLKSGEDLDYLELRNIGPIPLDLRGVSLSCGIQFQFGDGSALTLPAPPDPAHPDRSVFLVKKRAAFLDHYGPGLPVAGEFDGNLNNAGDTLCLNDAFGEIIQRFHFGPDWQPLTDGAGFALVHDPQGTVESWMDPTQWVLSAWEGYAGAPRGSATFSQPGVLFSEVSLAPSPETPGALELVSPVDADISGWFLSDQLTSPQRFRIPPGTTLRSNVPAVLSERLFGQASGFGPGFTLNPAGGSVFLFSADPQGRLTGYFDRVDYGPMASGQSLARVTDERGEIRWERLNEPSLGSLSGLPAVHSLIINEIHYHPASNTLADEADLEFLELRNVGSGPLILFNASAPTLSWRIRGDINFEFPRGLRLGAGSTLILVGFDPRREPWKLERFKSLTGASNPGLVLGPWSGRLSNGGGALILEAPAWDQGAARWIEEDRVLFDTRLPWPSEADGLGASLSRVSTSGSGLTANDWAATRPNPGETYDSNDTPAILIHPSSRVGSAYTDQFLGVLASPVTGLRYQWRRNGEPIEGAVQSTLALKAPTPDDSGFYDVLVMGRGGVLWSAACILQLRQPPVIYIQPTIPLAVAGGSYTVPVVALGDPPLTYQWRQNGRDLPNATNASLSLISVNAGSEGNYSVLIRDGYGGSVESLSAKLSVAFPPEVVWPPESQMVNVGDSIRLSVTTVGTPPIAYLWRKDGLNLRRPSSATVEISNAQLTNAGVYSLLLSNAATLRFIAAPHKANVLVLSDTDHDGMPDIWELTYGFRYFDPSDASLDADFDGMTNVEEYRAGTNPRDGNDYLKLDLSNDSRLSTHLGLLRFLSISNRSYSLQYSDQLSGNWTNWYSWPAATTNRSISLPVAMPETVPLRSFRLQLQRSGDPR